MVKKILPDYIKEKIKNRLMSGLYAVPKRDLDIANLIIGKGIPNMLTYSFINMKAQTLNYVDSLNINKFEYTYAQSVEQPVLYGSVYACMIKGYYGELDKLTSEEKKDWAGYFNSFQNKDDGYFYDPLLQGDTFEGNSNWGDGWGKKHLAAHLIIAYARLDHKPEYKFSFLEEYYNTDFVNKWITDLFETKNMWSASNYIMNIVTLLQYSRDYLGDKYADNSIMFVLNWLNQKQNKKTGLWHIKDLDSIDELNNAIRGAYHYFPLFIYENKPINHKKKIIDNILKTQNSWGCFEKELSPSGACEDIDALDPLIRFVKETNHRKEEVYIVIKRALVWIMTNYNSDGGFTYMADTPHEYGAHPLTSSLKGESNLMATWFRTLCLAYVVKYLNIPNDFKINRYPGYEINF